MKKTRNKTSRSFRPQRTGAQDIFFIDSISVLKDLLATKPQLLLDVSEHLRKDAQISRAKAPLAYRTYDDSIERRPVARIKLAMHDWAAFESKLDAYDAHGAGSGVGGGVGSGETSRVTGGETSANFANPASPASPGSPDGVGTGVAVPSRSSTGTSMLCALDGVQDPRNLGAIIRTAAFFGLHAVLIPQRRQAQLTQAAVATAQGGYAVTDLVSVVNLARSLEMLKDRGYWIVGAAMDGQPIRAFRAEHRIDKMVVVLGSEGEGLTQNIRKKCDFMVAIEGGHLDSLNVSVAAGIFFHGLK